MPNITDSSFLAAILPCATPTRTSGRRSSIWPTNFLRLEMLCCTKKTCPPRPTSYAIAFFIRLTSKTSIDVRMGCLPGGGVLMVETSRTPTRENCSVRGIGVALMLRKSQPGLSTRSISLCLAPKRCSSSTIIKPRLGTERSFERRRCVPTTTSTVDAARPDSVFLTSGGSVKRERCRTKTPKGSRRETKLL